MKINKFVFIAIVFPILSACTNKIILDDFPIVTSCMQGQALSVKSTSGGDNKVVAFSSSSEATSFHTFQSVGDILFKKKANTVNGIHGYFVDNNGKLELHLFYGGLNDSAIKNIQVSVEGNKLSEAPITPNTVRLASTSEDSSHKLYSTSFKAAHDGSKVVLGPFSSDSTKFKITRSDSSDTTPVHIYSATGAIVASTDDEIQIHCGDFETCGKCVSPDGRAVRTMFKENFAPYGDSCESETQNYVCSGFGKGHWTGTFPHDICVAEGPKACGSVAHGGTDRRTMYESATVPMEQRCKSELQTRSCNNGALSSWTGDYNSPTCSVQPPQSCGAVPHGGSQSRTMYQSSSVPIGQTCRSELQTRTCNNGTLSSWSGSFQYSSCNVIANQPCGSTPHGGKQYRTRYQTSSVPNGQSCKVENQSRVCNNGTFSTWTGSYQYSSCRVNEPTVFGGICGGTSKILGYVYQLPANTSRLPNFGTMNHVDTVCPQTINVPEQAWDKGFPGKATLVEWFAVRFLTNFYVDRSGTYKFRIHSDDGSKLIINNAMVIDNDGTHSPQSKTVSIHLNAGTHSMMVKYFQGPRVHIALQLFWTPPSSSETIMPAHVFRRP